VKQTLSRLRHIVDKAPPSESRTTNSDRLLKIHDAVSIQFERMKLYLTACAKACDKYRQFYGKRGTDSYAVELQSVFVSMSKLRLDAKNVQDACRKLRSNFKKYSLSLSDFCSMFMTDSEVVLTEESGTNGLHIIFHLQCPS
jgi:hypothetical protein